MFQFIKKKINKRELRNPLFFTEMCRYCYGIQYHTEKLYNVC